MKTFLPADILLPKTNLTKFACVACDQYTSDKEYWNDVSRFVGDEPSALRLILPEAYLDGDIKKMTADINNTMQKYMDDGVFETVEDSYIYTERTLSDGSVRRGIIGALDLDDYDFSKGSQTPIRATEGTVPERIPPRVAIRRDATLELPHIMILIDDRDGTVIEPLANRTDKPLYDFDLMKQGGHLKGWRVTKEEAARLQNALDKLADKKAFNEKYGLTDKEPLVFAVGDGNHSLATAKVCHTEHGQSRYALVEVVNLHDPSLTFEPIHRAVFSADYENLVTAMASFFDDIAFLEKPSCRTDVQRFTMLTRSGKTLVEIGHTPSNLPVGSLQLFLDRYVKTCHATVDYIHDDDALQRLVDDGAVGFLLPAMPKDELFRTVILDGALPRKTFSMGHAQDKRFYLEARKIK